MPAIQKKYFLKTSGEKVRGIVIVPDPVTKEASGKKYEYIDNTIYGVTTFLRFAKRRFPAAIHVNFYCRKTDQFIETIHLE